ncbi:uncharacterized protein [Periplaneta americana]|uniref:uncharacterized protein n=1 Tax=Periplaneta americana TaxID=6978 RepID=UPI0037E8B88C
MTMTNKFFLLLCFILLCEAILAGRLKDSGTHHSRKTRNLIYPAGSYIQYIFGFGLPYAVQDQSLTLGTALKMNYPMPPNSSIFTDPYSAFEKRSLSKTRWNLYSMLEVIIDRLELDGRACVLRAICEAADTTLQHNDLAGDVLHVLLTPSTTSDEVSSYSNFEYHAAERLGREISGSCHLLYPECEVGLLDLISKVDTYDEEF